MQFNRRDFLKIAAATGA
ncbi:MAG: twin-arginine translocation signal domain-containing protein, partial [Candidatus Competibacteraceae bacterium]|nr:twin-arginine translocation signal domain-containing protein [Candidatus Competibacteraceae bacterium]